MLYTCDGLANDIVARFNDYFYGTDPQAEPIIQFTPFNSETIPEVMVEQATEFSVLVWPDSETAEPLDRGDTCNEKLVAGVAVVGPMGGNISKEDAMRFVKQLRVALRGTAFDGDNGSRYIFYNDQITPLYDVEAFHKADQFVSGFLVTYDGLA